VRLLEHHNPRIFLRLAGVERLLSAGLDGLTGFLPTHVHSFSAAAIMARQTSCPPGHISAPGTSA
jgi:hypothetical protein